MMKRLAIEGHATRGEKVIEILEMLGGSNACKLIGNNSREIYYIDENYKNFITCSETKKVCGYIIFTLEEFLKKFPYKVGDRVKIPNCDVACRVTNMIWNGIEIEYETTNSEETFFADDLQPYKKETMKDYLVTEEDYGKTLEVEQEYIDAAERLMDQLADGTRWKRKDFDSQKMIALFLKKNTSIITEKEDSIIVDIPKGYEFSGIDDNNQKVIFEKIGYHYPKTYEECCEILGIRSDWHLTLELDTPATHDLSVTKEFDYVIKLESLRKLLICRNAYWKIAGEQMGLGKPWETKWKIDDVKYSILVVENEIRIGDNEEIQRILVFPTEEMRDAFLNSKEIAQLIEVCKEFL